jgi:hypothetical protein
MKKMFIVALIVSAATLAACGGKKKPAPVDPGMGSGSATTEPAGSGSDMGSAAPDGAGSGSAM